jgi:hemoglobin/transferrin/lactoferrin receptor protein
VLTAEFDKGTEDEENAFTGSLGISHDWSVTASYSRAFQVANGLTKTISSSAGTIPTLPNPQLKPETSDTYEGGIRFDNGIVRSSLVAYQSNYEDLIQLTSIKQGSELA